MKRAALLHRKSPRPSFFLLGEETSIEESKLKDLSDEVRNYLVAFLMNLI